VHTEKNEKGKRKRTKKKKRKKKKMYQWNIILEMKKVNSKFSLFHPKA
jgi:hypothetical protein